MRPEIYDHALLVDKNLAAHVDDLLEAGTINDRQAYMAWFLIAFCGKRYTARQRTG
jgi:hypothetical protein